ncbi:MULTISPECIES: heme-binding protein [unclassified Chryseobacterium]|uniref:heme-binding protein n=1 Tax=unclassified Chryseobacterium TaxID=2593645 RepID=UPI000D3A2F7D|nr:MULTISPECIES: heme-binding protein [unclassified Chryseobacterium]PTT75040.1 heme-binding protein [Chryseobacterium sp. HMWF001]PVV61623.1 heme-binding protein [Chryseobacterium sp. HMWF035]
MKIPFLLLLLSSCIVFGQNKTENTTIHHSADKYIKPVNNLNTEAALELANRMMKAASTKNKSVSVAVLDASGTTILLLRGNGVGPHNTEASRRKAYTALSTKTPTLLLLRNAEQNPDTKNLNTLPELLLLSGGVPIWYKGEIIGSVGVSGGGSPENDDWIARSASIPETGITTSK